MNEAHRNEHRIDLLERMAGLNMSCFDNPDMPGRGNDVLSTPSVSFTTCTFTVLPAVTLARKSRLSHYLPIKAY